jgi:hypothetical protein
VIVTVWQNNMPLCKSVSQLSLHQNTIALARRLAGVLRLLDLPDQELESLAHVLVVSRARLGPAALYLLGELLSIFGCDLSLLGSQVALVADDADGDRLSALVFLVSLRVARSGIRAHLPGG